MLKTAVKAVASTDRMKSGLMFSMMALKTLISSGTPTKMLNRCVVYHYTRLKLPKNEVSKKNKIDLN